MYKTAMCHLRYVVALSVLGGLAGASEGNEQKDERAAALAEWPKPGEAEADRTLSMVKALLDRKDLRLSAGPESAAKHFAFIVRAFTRRNPNGVRNYCVVRDGDRIFGEYRSGPGDRLIALVEDGFAVALDPKAAGSLILVNDAYPGFIIRGGGQDVEARYGGNVEAVYGIRAEHPDLVFDVKSIIEHTLPKVVGAKQHPVSGSLLLRTGNALLALHRAPPNATIPCAIRYAELETGAGVWKFTVMDREEAELRASVPKLTAEWAVRIGVPTRLADGKEIGTVVTDPRMLNIENDDEYLRASVQLERRPKSLDYRFFPADSDGQ
jgi:hypothetical protein